MTDNNIAARMERPDITQGGSRKDLVVDLRREGVATQPKPHSHTTCTVYQARLARVDGSQHERWVARVAEANKIAVVAATGRWVRHSLHTGQPHSVARTGKYAGWCIASTHAEALARR